MIDGVRIDGFRGIKKSEAALQLSDFTLLVGRNNSGKTSTLEALYSVCGGTDPLFVQNRSNVVKGLHGGNDLVYRYSGEGEIKVWKDGVKFEQAVGGKVSGSGRIGSSSDILYYPPSFKSLDTIYDGLQRRREEIEKTGSHVNVAEFINEFIDDEYSEIYLETLEMRKRPPEDSPYYIDIKDLGDGVLRAIPVYLIVEALEPELFLWDDITTSLHPGLTRGLIEWLVEQDTQFVGATHSIDLLSALIDIQPDTDVSILQLSKSGDDVLSHTKLDLEELELMMENAGHDPRFLNDELEI